VDGLRAVVEPGGDEAVSLQLWVRAGAADEPPGEEGAHHLLEHLLFRGPEGGTSPLASRVEAAGGEVNAFTSCDNTVFFATVAVDAWRDALDALLGAVFTPDIDPAVLATEREVVREEIAEVRDDPAELLGAAVREAAYGAHPYGRPITGTGAQVAALDLAAVLRTHGRAFRPEHSFLVAAGPLDPDALADALRGRLPTGPGGALADRPVVRHRTTPAAVSLALPGASSSRFELTWPGPSARHPDRAALDLLAWCLVTHAGTDDRDAEPLETEVWAPRQEGLITAWAAGTPGAVLDDLSAVVEAAEALRRRSLGTGELRDAQAALLAQHAFAGEAVEHRADRVGQGLTDCDDPRAHQAWRSALLGLKPDAVRRAAARWLRPEGLCAGIVSAEPVPRSAVEAAVAAGLRGAAPRRARRRLTSAPRSAHRDLPPASSPEPPRARRSTSGALLLVEPRPRTGVVSLQLAFAGGRGTEPLGCPGRLDLFADAWVAETPRRGPAELEATLDRIGGGLLPWVDLDGVGWRLDFVAGSTGRALALATELVDPPRFGARAVKEARRAARSSLGGRLGDAGTSASQAARSHLFAGHPWAMPAWGSIEGLEALDVAALRAAWRQHARAGGAVLSLAGDVDPAAALDALEALADRLPPGPPEAPPPLPEPTGARLRPSVPRGRGQVVFAWRGLAADDPDLLALEVLTTLLGSQSGPLFEQVRERHGLAYDVDVSHTEGRLGGALEIRIATDARRTSALRDVMVRTLEGLTDQLSEPAVAAAARLAAGRRRLDRQLASVRAEDRALAAVQGLPWTTPDTAAAALPGIDAARVRSVAARIIVDGPRVEAIVRPAAEGSEE
jgi:zinc protease